MRLKLLFAFLLAAVIIKDGTTQNEIYAVYDDNSSNTTTPPPPVVTTPPPPVVTTPPPPVVTTPPPPVVTTPPPPVVTTPQPPVVTTPQPPVVTTPQPPVVTTPQPPIVTTIQPPIGSDKYPASVPGPPGKPACIYSKMNISLTVEYEKVDNETTSGSLFVPSESEASGICGEIASSMTLSWPVQTPSVTRNIRSVYNVYDNDNAKNEITFHFKKDNSSVSVNQIDINIILDEMNFPNATEKTLKTTVENLKLFTAPADGSKYVCTAQTTDVRAMNDSVTLSIRDVDLIAFNEDYDLTQKSEENCSQEIVESSNVGAIVGGIIAALVVVGVIGFIIWRRRRNSYGRSEVA